MRCRLVLTLIAFLVAVCPPFLIVLRATEPTFVAYAESTSTDAGTTDETSGSITTLADDLVVVLGMISNNGVAGDTLGTPTGTSLSFSSITSVNHANAGNNDCTVYAWSSTASAGATTTIGSVTGTSNTALRSIIGVFQFRSSDGIGNNVTQDNASADTISLTRGSANSHVVHIRCDWNAAGDGDVDADPVGGTVRFEGALAGQADMFMLSWGDQGAAGATSYGVSGHASTDDWTSITVEVKGTAGGAAPVPKFTLLGVGP